MVIYAQNKQGFISNLPNIPKILRTNIHSILGVDVNDNEVLSWENSLAFMRDVIDCPEIPDTTGISLEYNIPFTNNRIDFFITGIDDNGKKHAIIIELKQWSSVYHTNKDAIVETYYESGLKETVHPSYQAACYASLLFDFNETIHNKEISLHPCSFLHNYRNDGELTDAFYKAYTDKAPIFCKGDEEKLRDFIKRYIRKGDEQRGIYDIDKGKLVPSKSLMDCVVSMSKGNPEFKMIDHQKVVYQNILSSYNQYEVSGRKQVVIVHGGPGTGKSVISVKLLFHMIQKGKLAHYITKNAAPRNVFFKKFTDSKNISVRSLFKSSSAYVYSKENEFDMLIVDEAHRLTLKSGYINCNGENQIKEIVNASKVSVFFIDDRQRVSLEDIGSTEEICKWAEHYGASINHQQLTTQFRCNSSDDYLTWLDCLLQLDKGIPRQLSKVNYDFRVFDSPTEMMNCLKRHNKNNKARMVAGYCWEWKSKSNKDVKDIVIPGTRFAYQWNLAKDNTWSISEGSIEQIGCIHTCQGLEFDYCGVIIGEDLIYRDGKVLVDPSKRAKDDYTIKGYKTFLKKDPEEAKDKIRLIIKNTYRTLMTRGMKGCFVYVMDPELKDYIKRNLSQ